MKTRTAIEILKVCIDGKLYLMQKHFQSKILQPGKVQSYVPGSDCINRLATIRFDIRI